MTESGQRDYLLWPLQFTTVRVWILLITTSDSPHLSTRTLPIALLYLLEASNSEPLGTKTFGICKEHDFNRWWGYPYTCSHTFECGHRPGNASACAILCHACSAWFCRYRPTGDTVARNTNTNSNNTSESSTLVRHTITAILAQMLNVPIEFRCSSVINIAKCC